MSSINANQSSSVGGPDATSGPDETTETAAPSAASAPAASADASQSGSAMSAQGSVQSSWAARAWHSIAGEADNVEDHVESAVKTGAAKVTTAVKDGENKVLDAEEPKNTSGFTPPRPPSIGVGLLNIAETAAARLGLMHPFKTYTSWVDQGVLMRGSEQNDQGWQALKDQGIKTVVNLRLEDNSEAAKVKALGMNAVQLPTYDQSLPSHEEMAAFVKLVKDPANQPVFVHCEQGVGRTGIMCAAVRIAKDGWTPDQAIDEARKMGMKSSDQEQFIRQFATDVQGGKYSGEF